MQIQELIVNGVYEISPSPHCDHRGCFMRTFDTHIFHRNGLCATWVQESLSRNKHRGIIRGLHFQMPPHTETKLVYVVVGSIYDVVVDLRISSATFGKWQAVELSEDNGKMLYLPPGVAHGFCTRADDTVVMYKMDAFYTASAQGGVRWDDPTLKIDWPTITPIMSTKDRMLPSLQDFESPFV